MPVAPKADHIWELLDRLHVVRGLHLPAEYAGIRERNWLDLVSFGQ